MPADLLLSIEELNAIAAGTDQPAQPQRRPAAAPAQPDASALRLSLEELNAIASGADEPPAPKPAAKPARASAQQRQAPPVLPAIPGTPNPFAPPTLAETDRTFARLQQQAQRKPTPQPLTPPSLREVEQQAARQQQQVTDPQARRGAQIAKAEQMRAETAFGKNSIDPLNLQPIRPRTGPEKLGKTAAEWAALPGGVAGGIIGGALGGPPGAALGGGLGLAGGAALSAEAQGAEGTRAKVRDLQTAGLLPAAPKLAAAGTPQRRAQEKALARWRGLLGEYQARIDAERGAELRDFPQGEQARIAAGTNVDALRGQPSNAQMEALLKRDAGKYTWAEFGKFLREKKIQPADHFDRELLTAALGARKVETLDRYERDGKVGAEVLIAVAGELIGAGVAPILFPQLVRAGRALAGSQAGRAVSRAGAEVADITGAAAIRGSEALRRAAKPTLERLAETAAPLIERTGKVGQAAVRGTRAVGQAGQLAGEQLGAAGRTLGGELTAVTEDRTRDAVAEALQSMGSYYLNEPDPTVRGALENALIGIAGAQGFNAAFGILGRGFRMTGSGYRYLRARVRRNPDPAAVEAAVQKLQDGEVPGQPAAPEQSAAPEADFFTEALEGLAAAAEQPAVPDAAGDFGAGEYFPPDATARPDQPGMLPETPEPDRFEAFGRALQEEFAPLPDEAPDAYLDRIANLLAEPPAAAVDAPAEAAPEAAPAATPGSTPAVGDRVTYRTRSGNTAEREVLKIEGEQVFVKGRKQPLRLAEVQPATNAPAAPSEPVVRPQAPQEAPAVAPTKPKPAEEPVTVAEAVPAAKGEPIVRPQAPGEARPADPDSLRARLERREAEALAKAEAAPQPAVAPKAPDERPARASEPADTPKSPVDTATKAEAQPAVVRPTAPSEAPAPATKAEARDRIRATAAAVDAHLADDPGTTSPDYDAWRTRHQALERAARVPRDQAQAQFGRAWVDDQLANLPRTGNATAGARRDHTRLSAIAATPRRERTAADQALLDDYYARLREGHSIQNHYRASNGDRPKPLAPDVPPDPEDLIPVPGTRWSVTTPDSAREYHASRLVDTETGEMVDFPHDTARVGRADGAVSYNVAANAQQSHAEAQSYAKAHPNRPATADAKAAVVRPAAPSEAPAPAKAPADLARAQREAEAAARFDGEIEAVKREVARLEKITDLGTGTPSSGTTGSSGRAKSLDRRHSREIDRQIEASKKLTAAREKLARLERNRQGFIDGERHASGQPRADAPSKQKRAAADAEYAAFLRARLKPGDSVMLRGSNGNIGIQRVNAKTITDTLGNTWPYSQLIPLGADGKPLSAGEFKDAFRAWQEARESGDTAEMEAARQELAETQAEAAKVFRQPMTQVRAKAGGEYGPNGEWYEGGKWIATSPETEKGAFAKIRKRGERENDRFARGVELEPGNRERRKIALGEAPLMERMQFGADVVPVAGGGGVNYQGEVRFQPLKGSTYSELDRQRIQGLIERWNRGERVLDLLKEPEMATAGDLIRYIAAGQPIPPGLMDQARSVLVGVDADRWNWLVARANTAAPIPAAKPEAVPAKAAEPKAKPTGRWSWGRNASEAEKAEVLKTRGDRYVDEKVELVVKGYTKDDEEIWGYPFTPEVFEKSSTTGRGVRHYVLLPDDTYAHPSEVYPELSDAALDALALIRSGKAVNAEKAEAYLQTHPKRANYGSALHNDGGYYTRKGWVEAAKKNPADPFTTWIAGIVDDRYSGASLDPAQRARLIAQDVQHAQTKLRYAAASSGYGGYVERVKDPRTGKITKKTSHGAVAVWMNKAKPLLVVGVTPTTAPNVIRHLRQSDEWQLILPPDPSVSVKAFDSATMDYLAAFPEVAARVAAEGDPASTAWKRSRAVTLTEARPEAAPVKAEPKPAPQAAPAITITGRESRTSTNTRKLTTRFAVVEADQLRTSHDDALAVNPDYPPDLQPRERDRQASREQIAELAAKLDPELLGDNPLAQHGAPIVGDDLAVESGNARAIALRTVYRANSERGTAYRDWVRENAAEFGLDPEAVTKLRNPVLIRVRETPLTAAERVAFAKEANSAPVATSSSSETAPQDAKGLTPALMAKFNPDQQGNLHAASNRAFVAEWLGTLPTNERGKLTGDDGAINQDGIARLRNALFYFAYPDRVALKRMAESTSDDTKTLTNALLHAAPAYARLRSDVESGVLHAVSVDIVPELMRAVNQLDVLRGQGVAVESWLKQTNLFDDPIAPLTKSLMLTLNTHRRSAKRIGEYLAEYADTVRKLGDPRTGNMFGEEVVPTADELWEVAYGRVEKRILEAKHGSQEQGSLFDGPADAPAGGAEDAAGSGRESSPTDGSAGPRGSTASSGGTETAETVAAKPPRLAEKVDAALAKAEEAAQERLKKQGFSGMLPGGVPPDLIVIGAIKLARGAVRFVDWSAQMVEQFGKEIEPHLAGIWRASRAVYNTRYRKQFADLPALPADDRPAAKAREPWQLTREEYEGTPRQRPAAFAGSAVTQPVYHGSPSAEITEFYTGDERGKLGGNTRARTAEMGAFFSESADIASTAAYGFSAGGALEGTRNPTLYEVYLNLRKPLDLDQMTDAAIAEIEEALPGFRAAYERDTDRFTALQFLSRQRAPAPANAPKQTNFATYAQGRGLTPDQVEQQFREQTSPLYREWRAEMDQISQGEIHRSRYPVARDVLQKLGYDGIIVRTMADSGDKLGPQRQYVVFNPKAIAMRRQRPVVEHRQHVEEALRGKKNVPAAVLAEYPDLASKYPRGAPAPADDRPADAPLVKAPAAKPEPAAPSQSELPVAEAAPVADTPTPAPKPAAETPTPAAAAPKPSPAPKPELKLPELRQKADAKRKNAEYAGSINLDRLDIPEELKDLIRAEFARREPEIAGQRRGVRSHAETVQAANELIRSGFLEKTAGSAKAGTAFNAEEIDGLARLHVRLLDDVRKAEAAHRKGESPETLAGIAEATSRFQAVHLALQGASTEAGRALNIHRRVKGLYRGLVPEQVAAVLFDETVEPPTTRANGKRVRLTPDDPEFGAHNKLFTRERGLAARDRLRARVTAAANKASKFHSGGVDPTLAADLAKAMPDLLEYGGYLLESGVRQFGAWSQQMREDAGPVLDDDAAVREVWDRLKAEAKARARQNQSARERARQELRDLMGDAGLTEKQMKALAELDEDDHVGAARLLRDSFRFSPGETFFSYFRTNILSGPGTHLRNLASNTLMGGTQVAERFFAVPVDAVVARTQGRAPTRTLADARAGAIGYLAGFPQGARDFLTILREGFSTDEAARLDIQRAQQFAGGALNPYNLNPRLMIGADAFFKALSFRSEQYALATRQALAEKRTGAEFAVRLEELLGDDEIQAAAQEAAQYFTFTSNPGAVAGAILKLRRAFPPLQFVIPFVTTPANVLNRSLEYSPLGFLQLFSAEKRAGESATEVITRGLIGTAIITSVSAAFQGLTEDQEPALELTAAAPRSAAQRDAFYRSGRKPYAVQIGGQWYGYRGLGPLSSLLSSVAVWKNDYWTKQQSTPVAEFFVNAVEIGRAFTDESFLSGLESLYEALTAPERKAEQLAARTVSGLVPLSSLLRSIQRAKDPVIRQPEGIRERVEQGLPGLGSRLPEKRDALGNVSRFGTSGLLALQPFVQGAQKNDPVDRELLRLRIFPSVAPGSLTLANEKIKLTRAQQADLQQRMGAAVYQELQALFRHRKYQSLTLEDRQEEVRASIDTVRRAEMDAFKGELADQRPAAGVR